MFNSPAVQGMPRSNALTGDTSSPESLSRAREWLRLCDESHKLCREFLGSGTNSYPARLIDLRPIQSGGLEGYRLIETNGRDKGSYVCLSHCWGPPSKPMPLRTLRSNLSTHLAFIPRKSFPSTFRDAITIATSLGFGYLWIDSLCIIQDSAKDWEAESANMAGIYGGSYLTIAAMSSPDSEGGCFSTTLDSARSPDVCFRVQSDQDEDQTDSTRHEDIILGMRDCSQTGVEVPRSSTKAVGVGTRLHREPLSSPHPCVGLPGENAVEAYSLLLSARAAAGMSSGRPLRVRLR